MPRKRKKRRRRGGLSRLLRPLSVILAAVAMVTALTLFFKVETIEVTGANRYQAEDIIAASGVEIGDNLILLDRWRVSQRIYTSLPYITDVRPKQKFPNTLSIEVTETQVTAAIQGSDAYWLLSSSGKLLEAVDAASAADCLHLIGIQADNPTVSEDLLLPEDSPISAERLIELLTVLTNAGALDRTDNVDCSDARVLVLNFDGRFRVEMYYDADFQFKIESLIKIVDEKLEPNEKGTLLMTLADEYQVNLVPSYD